MVLTRELLNCPNVSNLAFYVTKSNSLSQRMTLRTSMVWIRYMIYISAHYISRVHISPLGNMFTAIQKLHGYTDMYSGPI